MIAALKAIANTMNGPQLFARPFAATKNLQGETALRYIAATMVTLIALAGAQLVVPTAFVLWLVSITLLGVPFSLWLRERDGRIGRFDVPRPLWNAATVLGAGMASLYFLRAPLEHIGAALSSGSSEALLQMGQTEPMILLVQLFLIFAAFRSWTLLSDKDAMLAAVPSFSVLLLLIPIHRSVEVICYFLLWTGAATVLFALEHRSETRNLVVATVPAPTPGEDVRLAARSLAGVLGIALVVAVGLSGFLTARDPADGSSSQSAVAQMASRWTQWGMAWANSGSSTASGPQRQIDFSSSAVLPTRAVLWKARASTAEGKTIFPAYWRLFALSSYDGSTWSQSVEESQTIESVALSSGQWPGRQFSRRRITRAEVSREESQSDESGFSARRFERRNRKFLPRTGFPLASKDSALVGQFGSPRQLVFFEVRSARPNLGFIPLLMVPWSVVLANSEQDKLRVRSDNSLDVTLANAGQVIYGFSQVAVTQDNGFSGDTVPLKTVAPRAGAPRLSAQERALNLQLPAKVPARVRQLARDVTRRAASNASNFARARLLALATQRDAVYTLRPPTVPPEREAADFFLFESRRGYCTYFAGSLAVLCRSAGIPARVVSGFASPEPSSDGTVEIRDANAHAWTEVWVENWGWATIDATPQGDRGDNAPTFLETSHKNGIGTAER